MREDQEIPGTSERIDALELKIAKLEMQLAELAHARTPQSDPHPPLPAVKAVPPAESAATQIRKPKAELSLESIIAGQWLNHIGLLLILIATAFGLKYAFDNDWVGPAGRVMLGVISGSALLIFSRRLGKQGFVFFSEGITALGGGVLYLSFYAGWEFYKLFSSEVAFAAMVIVTAVICWIAHRRGSRRIALMALIGGFLTPMLVSTGHNAEAILFSYLLVLDLSLLWLAGKHEWRTPEPVAFVFTVVYFWGWYVKFFNVHESLLVTVLFASAFFVVFVALPAIRACGRGRIHGEQAAQLLLNAYNYLIVLHTLLWPDHRWALTGAVVSLAVFHLAVHKSLPRDNQESNVVRILFAGFALTFISLAIPIRLEGIWITMAWSVEGAVLVWSGIRERWWFLRLAGFVLFAGAMLRFVFSMPDAGVFIMNPRFATFAVAIASMGAAIYFWRIPPERTAVFENDLFKGLTIAVNVLALWALSLEVRQYFSEYDDRLVRQMALSLLWTAYACSLLATGVRRGVAGLRWQGLVLLGVAVGKVFLYDLSFLSGGYRIISSIVLGMVLLGVSFLYQRRDK